MLEFTMHMHMQNQFQANIGCVFAGRAISCSKMVDFHCILKAPFSLSRFKVPVYPSLMIRDEPCHNRGGTVDNLGDPG